MRSGKEREGRRCCSSAWDSVRETVRRLRRRDTMARAKAELQVRESPLEPLSGMRAPVVQRRVEVLSRG